VTTLVLGSYVNAHCLQVPSLPDVGQSVLANRYWSEHGGKGLNVGVGLKRLDADTVILLPVGDDKAGQDITDELQRMNIDTRWVIRCSYQSGYGMGLVDSQGHNLIAVFPGANAQLNTPSVLDALQQCRPCNLYAQLEIPLETVIAAFSAARQQSLCTILNPSPWQPLPAELMAMTQVMIINTTEAAALFNCNRQRLPQSPADWLQALPNLAGNINWQGDWLIVTLGDLGCVALGHDELLYQAALTIAAIDTTGAGDAFNAGLLWALERETPEQALRIANACGAYIAKHNGVLAHLPDRQTLQAFMASQPQPEGRRIKRAF
jgi:ribokinase